MPISAIFAGCWLLALSPLPPFLGRLTDSLRFRIRNPEPQTPETQTQTQTAARETTDAAPSLFFLPALIASRLANRGRRILRAFEWEVVRARDVLPTHGGVREGGRDGVVTLQQPYQVRWILLIMHYYHYH